MYSIYRELRPVSQAEAPLTHFLPMARTRGPSHNESPPPARVGSLEGAEEQQPA